MLMICSYVLSKNKYSDPESGFRALSRRAMEVMKFEQVGFFVESEMLYLVEKRPLFFFGIAGAMFTISGLIAGAGVLYTTLAGSGVAVGSALIAVLFIVIGVFAVLTGLILRLRCL